MDELVSLINNVGFPIVCCVVLFKQNGEMTKVLNSIKESLIELKNKVEKGEK